MLCRPGKLQKEAASALGLSLAEVFGDESGFTPRAGFALLGE
jgi:hypothetical protein